MAASRATSLRSLSKLASSTTQRNARQLHMTGPASVSSILTTDKPSFNKVQAAISDAATSNASKTASEAMTASTASVRHFNTSRSLKTVHDSSTIDFAYLPDFDPDSGAPAPAMRVPLLPPGMYPNSTKTSYTKEEEEIIEMKHEINLLSADGTHISAPSAMREVTDNGTIDFHGIAGDVLGQAKKVVEEEAGEIKKIWSGLLDDVLGAKTKHT